MGTLFVVATPIGNLEDLSFRALRTLGEVDLIAAEDTRRTAKLLAHYEIRKPMVSLREHNEQREAPRIVERILRGESVALVSDAGTPGIADPGQHLVALARARGLKVSPIPGPSAIMAALSASGLPANQFVFMGFPPRSGSDRKTWMEQLAAEARTAVAYEAPHRIRQTLKQLESVLVNRHIYAHRELTKIHEEFVVYPNSTSVEPQDRGEYVLVIAGKEEFTEDVQGLAESLAKATDIFGLLTTNRSTNDHDALKLSAKIADISEQNLKKAIKKARIEEKRRLERLS